ncbi:MAG: hypothetical protein ACRDDX_08610 [Cellulosilyticaceae bacterium]
MKKWNGYETTQVIGEKKKLPAGAYVCHIVDAREEVYGWGSTLVVSFDIAEGEHKDFYKQQYKTQKNDKKWKGTYRVNCPKDDGSEQDEKLKKNFKTFMSHIEKSNNGYLWNWDEGTLKGKLFGGIFGEKEYEIEGNTGFFTTLRYAIDIGSLKTARIPKPVMLNKQPQPQVATAIDWEDDSLPF